MVGGLGTALVLLGAALPYLTGASGDCGPNCDQCCPSFVVDEATGVESLNIPPASIVTLFGGISLIVAHLANLRCCSSCRVASTVSDINGELSIGHRPSAFIASTGASIGLTMMG